MRIVFFGTPQVAADSLSALVAAGHEVVAAVSQPDRPAGRSRRPTAPPVKRLAVEHGIPVLQPVKMGDPAFLEAVAEARPELLVVVAFGRILRRRLLRLAPQGPINVHFSLLPRYRGAAPVQWALARGEARTGVTTMRINERLDEGDILLQRELAIAAGEHAPSLQARLSVAGAELLNETVAGLAAGRLEGRGQDHAAATYAPILTVQDGEIDLGLSAVEIEGRIRGFDPWPGVWVRRKSGRLRLLQGRAAGSVRGERPGTVLELADDALPVVCGGGSVLLLTRVQAEGRRPMGVRDALNGRQILPGEVLRGSGAGT